MSAESTVYTALQNDAGVSAITNTIRPLKMKQGDVLPVITYQRIDTDHAGSVLGDTSNCDRVYLQIDCWATSYETVKSLADAVRTAMKTIKSNIIDSREDYEDETEYYRVSMDFYVWD